MQSGHDHYHEKKLFSQLQMNHKEGLILLLIKILRNTNSNRRIKTKYSLLTKVSPSNVFLRENISDGNSLLDASISDEGQKFVKYNNAVTKSSFFLAEILTKVFNVQPAI